MIRDPILVLTAMEGKLVGGMSGSPIVSAEGAAIGVACQGAEDGAGNQTGPAPNPSLLGNLPGWLLRGSRLTFSRPKVRGLRAGKKMMNERQGCR
jgi:hypothetical protein